MICRDTPTHGWVCVWLGGWVICTYITLKYTCIVIANGHLHGGGGSVGQLVGSGNIIKYQISMVIMFNMMCIHVCIHVCIHACMHMCACMGHPHPFQIFLRLTFVWQIDILVEFCTHKFRRVVNGFGGKKSHPHTNHPPLFG